VINGSTSNTRIIIEFQSCQNRYIWDLVYTCIMGTGFLLGYKGLGCEVGCSPLSIAKVKNEWSCTSLPHVCLHGMDSSKSSPFFNTFRIDIVFCFQKSESSQPKCVSV
jgi:hypothetical protein